MAGDGAPQQESLLDLSHLTEEEQTTILQVLLRDSDLRNVEDGRLSKLKHTVSDPVKFKFFSGEWFKEICALRHKRYGIDIVQASMRRRKKIKDIPLSAVAKGHVFERNGEAVMLSIPVPTNISPLEEVEEEGRGLGSEDQATPTPAPRRGIVPNKSPAITNDSSAAESECVTEQSDQREDAAEGEEQPVSQVDTERESDSSSILTELEGRLNPSSSVSSLQSGHTLSGSMMSLFSSGEFGLVDVRGSLQFSLHFDTKREELEVQVCRCQDLAVARKDRSDPYVKTYLLPDKSSQSKKKTSVKKKTVNPVYNETLKYKVKMMELKGRTLNLSVWHRDPLRRNVFLGEVEVCMADWDWSHTEPCWRPLVPRVQLSQDSISSRGTIVLSVKFSPAGSEGSGLPLTGELHIWVREAKGLIPTKGGSVDSFVKSYVLPDESRASRQKTRVVKRTVSPTYNHTMVYDGFHTSDLSEACAEVTLWEKTAVSAQQLGGVRLSLGTGLSYSQPVPWMDSTEEEITVWSSAINNPNTWVDASLPLRTNLVSRKE